MKPVTLQTADSTTNLVSSVGEEQHRTVDPPAMEVTQEIRFAVVMYGGVSLAIYINGVAQELLKLVRATARAPEQDPGQPQVARWSDQELKGSELVYRQLGRILAHNQRAAPLATLTPQAPIKTRFIVDLISGSSAGGINAIFLAKALANDQPLEELKTLWKREADIGLLINDQHSLQVNDRKHSKLRLQSPPRSLLNSQRMYCVLLEALNGMECGGESKASPNTDSLDLHITATDIEGQVLNLELADHKLVRERRHRSVFHFRYRREGTARQNDFSSDNNPFLAYAARCTSAFPGAFEPMCLDDINDVLRAYGDFRTKYGQWKSFFESYLQPSVKTTESSEENLIRAFAKREFSDGGVLDNKPFSYVIDALPLQSTEFPINRKLFYIEPTPEHLIASAGNDRIDALKNAWLSLSTLPRSETIREDVQRILYRNALIKRVTTIIEKIEEGAPLIPGEWLKLLEPEEWDRKNLAEIVKQKGLAWASYHRLRVSVVTDEIARELAFLLGINQDAAEFWPLRELVLRWRQQIYDMGKTKDKLSETQFLREFDYGWRLRRHKFVFAQIDRFMNLDGYDMNDQAAPQNAIWRILEGLTHIREDSQANPQLALTSENGMVQPSIYPTNEHLDAYPQGEELIAFNDELSSMRRKLRTSYDYYALLQTELRNPAVSVQYGDQVIESVEKLGLTAEILHTLMVPSQNSANTSTRELLIAKELDRYFGAHNTRIKETINILRRWIMDSLDAAHTAYALVLPKNRPVAMNGRTLAQLLVWHYFSNFDSYDMQIYPITYATQVGDELDPVEIYRISPDDATRIITDLKIQEKLTGTKLFSFGAFFKESFRSNDLLWGQLDGAERIITALLPEFYDQDTRNKLILEAQEAIITEEVLKNNPTFPTMQIHKKVTKATEDQMQEIHDIVVQEGQDRVWVEADRERLSKLETALHDLQTTIEQHYAQGTESPTASNTKPNKTITAESVQAPDPYRLDDTPTIYLQRQYEQADRKLDLGDTLRKAARVSKVFGYLLKGIDAQNRAPMVHVWVIRLARIFWGVVEVAAPGSLANLIAFHWLKLLYTFELLLVLLGTLFLYAPIQQFGFAALSITAVIHVIITLIGDWLFAEHKRQPHHRSEWIVLAATVVLIDILVLVLFSTHELWSLIQHMINPATDSLVRLVAMVVLLGSVLIITCLRLFLWVLKRANAHRAMTPSK